MIRFRCPACQKRLKAPEEGAGRKTHCPRCGQSLHIQPPAKGQAQDNIIPKAERLSIGFEAANPVHKDIPFVIIWEDELANKPMSPSSPVSPGNRESEESTKNHKSWTRKHFWWIVLSLAGGVPLAIMLAGLARADSQRKDELVQLMCVCGIVVVGFGLIVLISGVVTTFPKCGKWWARNCQGREEIGRSGGYKTVTRYDTITNASGQTVASVSRQEQVHVTRVTYLYFYACAYCRHKWNGVSTSEYED